MALQKGRADWAGTERAGEMSRVLVEVSQSDAIFECAFDPPTIG